MPTSVERNATWTAEMLVALRAQLDHVQERQIWSVLQRSGHQALAPTTSSTPKVVDQVSANLSPPALAKVFAESLEAKLSCQSSGGNPAWCYPSVPNHLLRSFGMVLSATPP
eukprot:TRINITY_DN11920_c0_g1_i2.p2 TRINITY_DN11920_c0_g1~~TRINITY_DN11920_c0_g1_i2.p2  ORF type:complete len:112 (+),score=15.13 TRINITY_DN11920_c0_g1_i2:314-649(+)